MPSVELHPGTSTTTRPPACSIRPSPTTARSAITGTGLDRSSRDRAGAGAGRPGHGGQPTSPSAPPSSSNTVTCSRESWNSTRPGLAAGGQRRSGRSRRRRPRGCLRRRRRRRRAVDLRRDGDRLRPSQDRQRRQQEARRRRLVPDAPPGRRRTGWPSQQTAPSDTGADGGGRWHQRHRHRHQQHSRDTTRRPVVIDETAPKLGFTLAAKIKRTTFLKKRACRSASRIRTSRSASTRSSSRTLKGVHMARAGDVMPRGEEPAAGRGQPQIALNSGKAEEASDRQDTEARRWRRGVRRGGRPAPS